MAPARSPTRWSSGLPIHLGEGYGGFHLDVINRQRIGSGHLQHIGARRAEQGIGHQLLRQIERHCARAVDLAPVHRDRAARRRCRIGNDYGVGPRDGKLQRPGASDSDLRRLAGNPGDGGLAPILGWRVTSSVGALAPSCSRLPDTRRQLLIGYGRKLAGRARPVHCRTPDWLC